MVNKIWRSKYLYINTTLSYFHAFNRPSRPDKYVWHGSYEDGERMENSYCDEWRTTNDGADGQASSLMAHKLLGQETYSCDKQFVVLCVQAASLYAR